MYKLYNFECINCNHIFEDLVQPDDPCPGCPNCSQVDGSPSITEKLLHTVGTAHAAMVNPAKIAEVMMKGRAIRQKITGKIPWRKNSYSQSGNE